MNKKDVMHHLETIAIYLELQGSNPFRIAAYRKAAQGLEKDIRSLKEIDDFSKIPGIGKGTNELINEFISLGTSQMLTSLKEEIPAGLIPLLKLPGLGGKRLALLYKDLGITDEKTLYEACVSGELEQVKGMGKKTAENILHALKKKSERPERLPVYDMLQIAEKVNTYLDKIPQIVQYSLAGSLRRLEDTIKDIDYIIVPEDRLQVREQLVGIDGVKKVIANGETKVSVTLEEDVDINIDFRLVEQEEFATTLHHFTGSKDHNIKMRQLAKQRNEKINEYGVENEETGELIQFNSEEKFFHHFGLEYIPPEMRDNTGEIELFQKPVSVIEHRQIQGDLHMHTTWSDGANSIEEMVVAARELGYRYITITDHSKFLKIANGLTEDRLRQQREAITILNEKYADIQILCGVEMDILPNGKLDFSDDFLQEMDVVIAAIHSSFDQTEDQIMKRLFTALEHPSVDIIAHPTGRIIGRRKGYNVNMPELIKKAAETNTALELNANPMRFDLTTEWLKKAQAAGVPIAINTDAHNRSSLRYMSYGVRRAKKASIVSDTVMNTWTLKEIFRFIHRNK